MKPDKEIKEGQYFQFKVLKHIELTENEKFFMLEDEFGRKQLMPSEYYEKYNFNIGDLISCRVDHINCSGKVFLEPIHPFYQEGETYTFIVHRSYLTKNTLGEDVRIVEVKDCFNETALCKIDNRELKFEIASEIVCKVERIKKGKLYLRFANEETYPLFEIGNYYWFTIEDIRKLTDGHVYYILKDDQKNTYILKKEYYKHHNFEIGKKIECTIQKFSSKGYYVLEPRHPYYEIGKTYEFEFDRQFSTEKQDLTGDYEVVVKDVYDEEVRFVSDKTIEQKTILCKVYGIKKGKALLTLS